MEAIKYFNIIVVTICILVWLAAIVFLRLRKNKSFIYLFFFTVFFIYIVKVFDYTLFQYQFLLILKNFVPGLMLNGQTTAESINIIPLMTLTAADIKTSLLNICMLIPFGFGLPFITQYRLKQIVVSGTLFSIMIELLQLLTGSLAGSTFRIVDINDVLFNTLGTIVGYFLFGGFVHFLQYLFPHLKTSHTSIMGDIIQRHTSE